MSLLTNLSRCAGVAMLAWSGAAAAADEQAEFWIAPKASVSLDDNTALELDTMIRLREEASSSDTFYARLWLAQKLSKSLTVSAGAEARNNNRGPDETRFLQQVSLKSGIWRARLRFEQRLVEASRLGLRVRGRGGISIPLDKEERWSGFGDAELMVTLRSPSSTGFSGLTGVRTQIGVARKLSDTLSLSLGYVRNQEIRRGGPDAVGHAPLLGIDLSL